MIALNQDLPVVVAVVVVIMMILVMIGMKGLRDVEIVKKRDMINILRYVYCSMFLFSFFFGSKILIVVGHY